MAPSPLCLITSEAPGLPSSPRTDSMSHATMSPAPLPSAPSPSSAGPAPRPMLVPLAVCEGSQPSLAIASASVLTTPLSTRASAPSPSAGTPTSASASASSAVSDAASASASITSPDPEGAGSPSVGTATAAALPQRSSSHIRIARHRAVTPTEPPLSAGSRMSFSNPIKSLLPSIFSASPSSAPPVAAVYPPLTAPKSHASASAASAHGDGSEPAAPPSSASDGRYSASDARRARDHADTTAPAMAAPASGSLRSLSPPAGDGGPPATPRLRHQRTRVPLISEPPWRGRTLSTKQPPHAMGIQRIPELMSVPAYQTLLELTDRYPQLAGHATDLVRFSSLYASGTRVRRDPSPASVNPAILTETAEQLHAFLEAFESHAGDVLPEISDAQLKTLVDGAETLIMHHAFRRLFSACLSVYQLQDIHLSRRLCFMKLGDFSITHLGLTPASHDDMGGVPRTSTAHQSALRAKQLKQQAGLALLAFDSAHTPLQKMDQIIRCHQSLDQYAQHVSWCKTPLSPCLSKESLNPIGIQAAAAAAAAAAGSPATSSDGPPPTTDPVPRTPASPRPFVPSGAPTSADVILPLLIALIVDIGPPRLVSSLHFVETYRRAEAIEGYVAYCFTNLQAAVTFVETMDLSVLTMPADEVAAFERSHGGTRPEQDHATTVEQQRDVIVLPSDPQACEPAAAPHPDRHEPTRVSQAITGIHGMVSGLWPFPSVLPEMPTSMWVRGAESAAPSPTPSASSATQPPRPQQPIALLSSSLERRWSRSPPPVRGVAAASTAADAVASTAAAAATSSVHGRAPMLPSASLMPPPTPPRGPPSPTTHPTAAVSAPITAPLPATAVSSSPPPTSRAVIIAAVRDEEDNEDNEDFSNDRPSDSGAASRFASLATIETAASASATPTPAQGDGEDTLAAQSPTGEGPSGSSTPLADRKNAEAPMLPRPPSGSLRSQYSSESFREALRTRGP